MKKAVVLVLCAMPTIVHAQTYEATIVDSDCEVVAKSGSATGAVVGSSVGAVAGGVLGRALFGRNGGTLGALAGAIGGGAAGESIAASRTYSCAITVELFDGKKLYLQSLGKPYNIGERVAVMRLSDGSYTIKRRH